ncbi:SDR family oxidoreductase [candidate division WOR-3 bacterium]|nr:SDR family oxidoreductase [candidate division WOR-3 bacterium]
MADSTAGRQFCSSPLAVVTGATGHVGNVLVRELVSRGHGVRAVVQPAETSEAIAGLDVEMVRADVRDYGSLVRAFAGADLVYHLAGVITISGGQARLLEDVNVRGASNVARACREAGVRRMVYTSSVHALAVPPPGVALCETTEFRPEALDGDYARSKARASIEIRKSVEQGLDAVMVFPSGIIGPYDFRLSEMGHLFSDFVRGRLRVYVDGAYDFVDVRDVVAGLMLAAEKGRRGEGYILSGERSTVRDLLVLLQQATGIRSRARRLPMRLARFAAWFAPAYYRLRHAKPRFTSYSLRVLASNCLMSCAKAARELGYAPRPLQETVRNTIEWFVATGRLQLKLPPISVDVLHSWNAPQSVQAPSFLTPGNRNAIRSRMASGKGELGDRDLNPN